MPWSRRRIVRAVSAVYLLIPLALAAYALHTIRTHSLPIPIILSAFTLALPVIAGLALESISSLHLHETHPQRSLATSYPLTILALTIYETVLATLTGTYLHPIASLGCGLDERWQALYHNRDERAIRRIQDAFECCGLNTVVDRMWPFPGGRDHVDPSTCSTRYGRDRPCFGPWRDEERRVAGVMLGAVVLVFVWKAFILLWPDAAEQTSWYDMFGRRQGEAQDRGAGSPRRIDYYAVEDRYTDDEPVHSDVGAAVDGGPEPEQTLAREASTEASRTHDEHERWAN